MKLLVALLIVLVIRLAPVALIPMLWLGLALAVFAGVLSIWLLPIIWSWA